MTDTDLLKRIESLGHAVKNLSETTENGRELARFDYVLQCLSSLTDAVSHGRDIFGVEPWHPVRDDVPLSCPGEMLLRLKDKKGEALPPYPAIMTFYQNNLTADIDTVLVLCALDQFKRSAEKQVSINISARSLRNTEFVKIVLQQLETLDLAEDEKIIVEIHESTPNLQMSRKVLDLFREAGVAFAIDDVGLSMNDVLRLSEFEVIADFIKLDRKSVRSHPENSNSLDHVVSLITSILPGAVLVAEGVKDAGHAQKLHEYHPAIKYVQGMHLPGRTEFFQEWAAIN